MRRILLLNMKSRKKWFGLSVYWWLDIALNLFFFFVTFFSFSHKQIPLPSLFSFYSCVKAATEIESLSKGSHHYYEHVRPLFCLGLCSAFVGWDLTLECNHLLFIFSRDVRLRKITVIFFFFFMWLIIIRKQKILTYMSHSHVGADVHFSIYCNLSS